MTVTVRIIIKFGAMMSKTVVKHVIPIFLKCNTYISISRFYNTQDLEENRVSFQNSEMEPENGFYDKNRLRFKDIPKAKLKSVGWCLMLIFA